ncbi:MAG: hypothetical protein ACI4D7_08795 [Lachnospiraceae bacterium]
MKKRTKIVLIIVSALLIVGLFGGVFYLKSIADYKAKVAALTFSEIDLTKVKDGTAELFGRR